MKKVILTFILILTAYSSNSLLSAYCRKTGWLVFIGDNDGIIFPINSKELIETSSSFFKITRRYDGFNTFAGLDEYKYILGNVYEKKYLKMFYGYDTLVVVPVYYSVGVDKNSRTLFKNATKDQYDNVGRISFLYNKKEYLLDYQYFDSFYVKSVKPFLFNNEDGKDCQER